MSDRDAINLVADRFVAAVAKGDRAGLEAVFDETAVVWHNTNRTEKDRAATIDAIAAAARIRPFSYENIRRSVFPTGFVQQHDVTAVDAAGGLFEMPVCIVVQVKDGKIARLDEYYDSNQRVNLK